MGIKDIFQDDMGAISYLILFFVILILVFGFLFTIALRLRSPAGKGFVQLAPPIQVVWAMYESARRGDIDQYLSCFVPESQSSIRQTLKSMGRDAFKEYLRRKGTGILNVSIYSSRFDENVESDRIDPEGRPASQKDLISLPVEITFKGRNEVQVFHLKRIGKAWKILTISLPRLTPQPIPYGQNVNE